MTGTITPKVEILASQTQPPPPPFDRWVVVSWRSGSKGWEIKAHRIRKTAEELYESHLTDPHYGVVKLLWVSESGRPEPESGVVNDA